MPSTLTDIRSISFVDSLSAAEDFLYWLTGVNEPLAVDTETTGLRWWEDRFVRLIQFGTRDEGWAVPTDSWKAVARDAMQYVRDKELPVIFHNCSFDMKALMADGYATPEWHNVHDTKVLHHLLVPHHNHSLKPLCEKRWGPAATAGQSVLKAKMAENKWDWATVPEDCVEWWSYGVLDCLLTRRLWDELYPEVKAAGMQTAYEREMSVIDILTRAEMRGIRIDTAYTERLQNEWIVEAAALNAQLIEAGVRGNPDSNRQVEAVLRELGWEPDEFTETGQAKLDKVILKQLSQHPVYGTVAEPLIRYKRITKWNQVYLKPFLRDADSEGRIHPSINSLQARTGRMSVTGPPFQTLPSGDPAIRRCVLPSEGSRLWSIDYQAQEARLFVNDAQDWELAQVILNGGDLYTHFAKAIYQDPSITKDDDRRDTIKVMVLAMMYGAGAETLSNSTGLPQAEVADILVRLFNAYPSIPALTGDSAVGGSSRGMFAEAALSRLQEEGLAYILTTGGRRFSMEPDALYKAVNGRQQGSGADCLKDALVRLDAAGLADNVVMPVHDELLMEFTEGDEDAAQSAAELIEDHSFYVPLVAEVKGPLDNWGQAYE
jgi:DNA polymerase-1